MVRKECQKLGLEATRPTEAGKRRRLESADDEKILCLSKVLSGARARFGNEWELPRVGPEEESQEKDRATPPELKDADDGGARGERPAP